MCADMTWIAVLATVAVLLLYELVLVLAQRRNPLRLARSAHHRENGHT